MKQYCKMFLPVILAGFLSFPVMFFSSCSERNADKQKAETPKVEERKPNLTEPNMPKDVGLWLDYDGESIDFDLPQVLIPMHCEIIAAGYKRWNGATRMYVLRDTTTGYQFWAQEVLSSGRKIIAPKFILTDTMIHTMVRVTGSEKTKVRMKE